MPALREGDPTTALGAWQPHLRFLDSDPDDVVDRCRFAAIHAIATESSTDAETAARLTGFSLAPGNRLGVTLRPGDRRLFEAARDRARASTGTLASRNSKRWARRLRGRNCPGHDPDGPI